MRSPSKLADDIYQGLGGLYAGAKAIALQAHKRATDDYVHGLERDKRIGLGLLGHDVPEVDRQIAEQRGASDGEDVDSSVNISGDTHIHVAPGSPMPAIEQITGRKPKIPQPAPQPPQQPQPAPQPPAAKLPPWAKWAIGALLGTNVGGAGLLAWYLAQRPTTPPTDAGGSIFRFETELPDWMNDDKNM